MSSGLERLIVKSTEGLELRLDECSFYAIVYHEIHD